MDQMNVQVFILALLKAAVSLPPVYVVKGIKSIPFVCLSFGAHMDE